MEDIGAGNLISGLNLTKREERFLRQITGLSYREPRTRLERWLHGPLKTWEALVALMVIITLLAAICFTAWKVPECEPCNEFLRGLEKFYLPLFLLAMAFAQRRHKKLILKLYRGLEGQVGGSVASQPAPPV